MVRRCCAILLGLLVFFVASGAAIDVHEALEHHAGGVALADRVERDSEPLQAEATKGKSLPAHRGAHHHDCDVCAMLLHFVAVAVVVWILNDWSGEGAKPQATSRDAPHVLAGRASRSSRGPPGDFGLRLAVIE